MRLPARLARELPKAHRLLAQERWKEAFQLLEQLNRKFPDRPEVLGELVNASYEMNDDQSYLRYMRPYAELVPDAETLLGLGGAYLANHYLFAAFHYFQAFVDQYPDHERADEIRAKLSKLQVISADLMAQLDPEGEDNSELAFWHDMLRASLELLDFDAARQIGKDLLEKHPTFAPALNNLSQIEFLDGDAELAIEYCQRVLQADPDNFQASGNLTRYLYLMGKEDEAHREAERLKILDSEDGDIWLKKAEALSYLGDDRGVLDVVKAAEQRVKIERRAQFGHFYHLGGVAAARLGNTVQAETYWRKALELAPSLTIAQENLKDLRSKPGEQNGPWPFTAQQWLQSSYFNDMREKLAGGELHKSGKRPASELLQPYLEAHPHVIHLASVLFDRGDPQGRNIAAELARYSEHPELLELLKDFTLGQKGTDEQRMQSLGILTELNVIPRGPVQMWVKGEWTELMALGFEIGDESDVAHPFKNELARQNMEKATLLTHDERYEEALELLEEAAELEPDNPGVLNNLAGVRSRLGDPDEVVETLQKLVKEFPDYLFGHTGMANQYIKEGEIDKAEEHLKPLLQRHRLHYSEFRALADSYIRLYLAQRKPEGAQTWMDMWRRMEPENPQLDYWQSRVDLMSNLDTTKRRRRKFR